MVVEDFGERSYESVPVRIFRLLHDNHFYPLVVASITAMGFYFAERWTSEWRGPRLHLNLFLAWVPYFLGIALMLSASFSGGRLVSAMRVFCLLAWFFFFPNAPYLITDFAYLDWAHFDLWQRVAIFCIFAQCGLMLAMVSLLIIEKQTSAWYGIAFSKVLVVAAIVFSGFGVYVGRFLRWNSWDLLYHPYSVFLDSLGKLSEPMQGIRPIVFSAMFSLILGTYYYFVVSLTKRRVDKNVPRRYED